MLTVQNRERAASVARDARVVVVHVFFLCSAAIYFVDSIHLAVVLMQLNLIEVRHLACSGDQRRCLNTSSDIYFAIV